VGLNYIIVYFDYLNVILFQSYFYLVIREREARRSEFVEIFTSSWRVDTNWSR